MCWQLKIGLSAWGNAQAQSHYQTKLSSDVEPVYFWGVKSQAISSLCNWRLDGALVAAERRRETRGIMKRWVCAVRFPSPVSHLAVLFFCITQCPLNIHPQCSDTKVATLFFPSRNNWLLKMLRCWLLVWLQSAATMQNIWKNLLYQRRIVKKKICTLFNMSVFWITSMPTNTPSIKNTTLRCWMGRFLLLLFFCCAITTQLLIKKLIKKLIIKKGAQTPQSNIHLLNLEMALKRPFSLNPLHQFTFWQQCVSHLWVNSILGFSCAHCFSASEGHVWGSKVTKDWHLGGASRRF